MTACVAAASVVIWLGASQSRAQTFSNFYIFGGSYSDAGTYTYDGQQRRWTINPAPVWNQHVGQNYGIAVTPNAIIDTSLPPPPVGSGDVTQQLTGNNYAQGGSRVLEEPGTFSWQSRSVARQVLRHLAENGGRAHPTALYSLEGGGNDIFYQAAQVGNGSISVLQAFGLIEVAAVEFVALAGVLRAAGARHILVLNVHDIGTTPIARQMINNITPGQEAAFFTAASIAYNATLLEGLKLIGGTNFIYVNTFGFFNEIIANPTAYGFTNSRDPACVPVAQFMSLACTTANPATLNPGVSPTTYFFADEVHPSGSGHLALAQYIQSILTAPGLVATTAEVPLHVGRGIYRTLDGRFPRTGDGISVYGDTDLSGLGVDRIAGATGGSGGAASGHVGFDYRLFQRLVLGALFNVGEGRYRFSANEDAFLNTARIDMKMLSLTGYGGLDLGPLSAQVSGTVGHLDYDSIKRQFNVFMGQRTNEGSTNGHYYAARIKAGYDVPFGVGTLTPISALTYQKVAVDGYTEGQQDSSTMMFGRQKREVLFGTFGAQYARPMTIESFAVKVGGGFSYNYDFLNRSREMLAGLVDAQGLLFAMPVVQPERSWWDAHGGLTAQFGSNVVGRMAVGTQFSPSNFISYWANIGVVARL